MKKSNTVLLATSIFVVAVNMNGCGAYGPPPEDFDYRPPTATPVVEQQMPTQIPVDPANWYRVTQGQYAVVRLLSVAEEENVPEGQRGNVVCRIEVLSIYNPRTDLGIPSIIKIPGEDSASFSEGDVLFVVLGPMEYDGETYSICRLMEGVKGAIFAPFENNQLVLTTGLTKSSFYSSLTAYNKSIQEYRQHLEKSEPYYMEYGTQPFEEGMTTEEMATFFQEFQKAKKDYEEVLIEINGTK